MTIKAFSTLGIVPDATNQFVGPKIEMFKILNQQIEVHNFKIVKSKFEGKGNCLHMQIKFEGKDHVVFTTGARLQNILERAKADLPFSTTIIKNDGMYHFS